jgi:predicted nucleic acid-binding protein
VAVYLDSSALVKLVVAEAESARLRRWLRRHPVRVSSALARVEVRRAVRLQGEPASHRAAKVLGRIRLLRLDDALLEAAAALDPRVLRSLDAVHLASAQALGDELSCVVTYDRRMADAAGLLLLAVRAPGAIWDRPARRGRRVTPT